MCFRSDVGSWRGMKYAALISQLRVCDKQSECELETPADICHLLFIV